MALNHFLIVYDRRASKLLELKEFGPHIHDATSAYAEVEEEYRNRDDHENFEIVLIGADSLETLKVTHSRYFEDVELVPFAN